MKLSIQLYSLRAESEKDFVGVLEYVAKLGFQGVEFAGYYGLSAEEIRAHLDRLGLVCSSTHTPAPDVFEKTEETISDYCKLYDTLQGRNTEACGRIGEEI